MFSDSKEETRTASANGNVSSRFPMKQRSASILAASSRYAVSASANENVSLRYTMRQRSVLMEDDQTVTFADLITSRRDHSRDSSTRESLGRPSDQHRSSQTALFDFTLGTPPPGGRPSTLRRSFDDLQRPDHRHNNWIDQRFDPRYDPHHNPGNGQEYDFRCDALLRMLPRTEIPIFDGHPMKWV